MRAQTFLKRSAAVLALLACVLEARAEGGRLPATGGVNQFEGAAGGGLTPWALIGGYGTRDEIGATAFTTWIDTGDYNLRTFGAAVGIFDRLELSYANEQFDLGEKVPGQAIEMHVVGAKLKLAGDAVYDQDRWLPQLALGLQYKRNEDFDPVPRLVGAADSEGVDAYLSASKLYLGAVVGYNLLANATLRATRANQFGLLGFGGDREDGYSAEIEGSLAVMLTDRLLAGVEGRTRPDNLSAIPEDDVYDVFVAWFPLKQLAVTAAFVDLGRIVDPDPQRACYLSLQVSY